MAETSKTNRAKRSTAPVNRRTTSRTWGKGASGFDGSFKRTKYGYPSASARLAMQANSSLWGRRRVVGSKLKHDGTLGYISRGAARRSGLNPAGWHRYVPVVVVVAVIVIALAALGYAGGGANLDAMLSRPSSRMQAQKLSRAFRPRRASRPSAVSLRRPPLLPMRKRTRANATTAPKRLTRTKRRQLHRQDKSRVGQQIWDGAFFSCPSVECQQWCTRCQSPTASEPHLRQGDVK